MIPGVRSVRKEKDRSRKNRGEREMVDLSDELRTRKNIVCYDKIPFVTFMPTLEQPAGS
jgi:hypothetical protein